MAKIIEKRFINDHIECSHGIGTADVYVPVGVFGRTWFMKKSDGTVMECRVTEAGHCRVETDKGGTERRCLAKYETPEGKFMWHGKYEKLVLYPSYEDAVRCTRGRTPYICYEVDCKTAGMYVRTSVVDKFRELGFEGFEMIGTWNNILSVYGFTYKNGCLQRHTIKSTMWIDKDGLHVEPIIPDGVFKTKEEAYASNMPKLVTFDDERDDDEDFAERKREEFREYVAHHCPGFEDKIEWEYFMNLKSMPENLAEQVRVWSNN